LNSEIDTDETVKLDKRQIEGDHRFLLQQDVERIAEMRTEMQVRQVVYLHALVWFVKYEYRGEAYQLLIDGASGTAIKGDIPMRGF
jgi:hypothetical protein